MGPRLSIGRHLVRRVVGSVADILYPPVCAFCAATPGDRFAEDAVRLCIDCRNAFVMDDDGCQKCGMPVGPHVNREDGCFRCAGRSFRFDRVLRLGIYRDDLRRACIRAKSPGAEPLAGALASLLCQTHRDALASLQFDSVLMVPQFWGHRITRPHHSAETMAEVIAERLEVPFHRRLLRKPKRTPDQSALPRAERLKNLHRAFAVRRGTNLSGQRLLLIDDILTTGTTANECSRALRAAGAELIGVAVIAVVE